MELLGASDRLDSRFYVEIFSDLLKSNGEHARVLFPQLLDGLRDPRLAPFVLDYANFAYRQHHLDFHPAADRLQELIAILSQLAERLGKIQDAKPKDDADATQLGKQVTEGVSLGISLCDALACHWRPSSGGVFKQDTWRRTPAVTGRSGHGVGSSGSRGCEIATLGDGIRSDRATAGFALRRGT